MDKRLERILPRVQKPALAPLQSMDLLFVQAQYDGATPAEGADRLFARLPQGAAANAPSSASSSVTR